MTRSRRGLPVHGWIVLDKPVGMTSTQAVARIKRATHAQRVGHGGTLDPLASGILPIALGEATKTVSYAMDARKTYRFTLRWGQATETDDAEGEIIAESDVRPDPKAILAALPAFFGEIIQMPPQYSAIKINGERAYDLARAGDDPEMAPRTIQIEEIRLLRVIDHDHAEFEVTCGKGAYMRALARDIAVALGTVGHVAALRRLNVGPFTLDDAVTLEAIDQAAQGESAATMILPVERALDDIPALDLTETEAQRLRHGQSIALITRQDRERLDAMRHGLGTDGEATALAVADGRPVALVRLEGAEVKPVRVLNL